MNDLLSYQSHSETSKEAAENHPAASAQRENVYQFIEHNGAHGATTDEVKENLFSRGLIGKNSVMSARVRELELSGRIVKTTNKRNTSAGRKANVYVTKAVFNNGGLNQDVTKGKTQLSVLQAENQAMKTILGDVSTWLDRSGTVTLEKGGNFHKRVNQII